MTVHEIDHPEKMYTSYSVYLDIEKKYRICQEGKIRKIYCKLAISK